MHYCAKEWCPNPFPPCELLTVPLMAVPTSIPTLFPPPSLGNRFGLHPTKVIFAPKSFFGLQWCAGSPFGLLLLRLCARNSSCQGHGKEIKIWRNGVELDLTHWSSAPPFALFFYYLLSFVIGVFDGVPGGPWNRELTALVHPTHLVPVQGSQHRGLLHGASTMTLPSFVFYIRHLGTFWRSQRPDFSWPSMGKAWEQRRPRCYFALMTAGSGAPLTQKCYVVPCMGLLCTSIAAHSNNVLFAFVMKGTRESSLLCISCCLFLQQMEHFITVCFCAGIVCREERRRLFISVWCKSHPRGQWWCNSMLLVDSRPPAVYCRLLRETKANTNATGVKCLRSWCFFSNFSTTTSLEVSERFLNVRNFPSAVVSTKFRTLKFFEYSCRFESFFSEE